MIVFNYYYCLSQLNSDAMVIFTGYIQTELSYASLYTHL